MSAFSATPWSARAADREVALRYVRYSHQNTIAYGLLRDDVIDELAGPPFGSPEPTGRTVAASEVRLLAPCEPSKVLAVGLNYRSHLDGRPLPDPPGIFIKLPTSIAGPGDPIVLPADAHNVHYEGELVIVIGRRAHGVAAAVADDYVFGVTAGNDVSERDWQRDDLQWFRAKGCDTFGPIGPVIATDLDYGNLHLQTRVNGEVRQEQSTNDIVYGILEIVSYISHYATLLPGDVIFTGTPGNTQAVRNGDAVEVEIEGIGVLRNTVLRP